MKRLIPWRAARIAVPLGGFAFLFLFLAYPGSGASAVAQTHGMHRGAQQDSAMSMQHQPDAMRMSSAVLLTVPMERDGSGTSWLLLLQTGELWNGRRLVDSQHPHDLCVELAAA